MLAIAIQWTKRTTFISLAPILTRILAIFVFSLLENYSLEFFIVCLYIVINHALPNPLKSGSWPNISLSLSLALGNIGHIEPLFPFWTSFIPSFWDSTLSWSSSSFCYASVLALLTVSPISSTSIPEVANTTTNEVTAHSNLQGPLASCPNPILQPSLLFFSYCRLFSD